MVSESDNVPHILHLLRQISKCRATTMKIMDVGAGSGKWGFLFRAWLDQAIAGPDKAKWKHQIDCVEIFEDYISPVHKFIYDNIIIDDFRNLFRGSSSHYNLIMMGDCLEHVPMDEGIETIERYLDYCDNLIISVPGFTDRQGARFGNESERHLAWYTEDDFLKIRKGKCSVARIGRLITAHYKMKG